MADAMFHSLLTALGAGPKKPTPVGNIPTGSGGPPRPTPIPNVPDFNPMGRKKPTTPTPIPGVAPYNRGLGTSTGSRSLLGR